MKKGWPEETRTEVCETIRYGLKLAARGVDEVSINIFSPYPGSELYRELADAGKIQLGDRYFLQLTSLNSDYTRTNPLTLNPVMGPRELALYRISFMLLTYLVGYVLHPGRSCRTIRNVFLSRHAAGPSAAGRCAAGACPFGTRTSSAAPRSSRTRRPRSCFP